MIDAEMGRTETKVPDDEMEDDQWVYELLGLHKVNANKKRSLTCATRIGWGKDEVR